MMIWCLIKTRDNPWLISHMQSAKSDNGYFSMKGNTHTMCIACNLLRSFSLKGLCSSIIIDLKIWFLDWLLKLIFCQVTAAWKFRSTMFSFISCLLSLKKWKYNIVAKKNWTNSHQAESWIFISVVESSLAFHRHVFD